MTQSRRESESRAVPRPEDFRFRCLVEVRFRDLDAMGHVNNAVYFTYFEIARAAYMKALGHWSPTGSSRGLGELFPFILADARCRFLAPATLGDVLVVCLRTTTVGRKSFELEYLIRKQATGEPVAAGWSTQVCYDYALGTTCEMPRRILELLEQLEERPLQPTAG